MTISVTAMAINAIKLIVPTSFADARGRFSETYNRADLAEQGIDLEFIQDNESTSDAAGTVRGLHFQSPPMAQDKLIRVTRGRIFDVAVDLRRSSSTFGQWVGEELSAANRKQMLVPAGFAHGFCTLEPDTQVLYKVSSHYSPAHDLGIAWNDPDLAITWPVMPEQAVLSVKDLALPRFHSLPVYFG